MEQGVYIFDSKTDFLQAMEQLNHHYCDKPTAIYLSKKVETTKQLKKELSFIDKCSINGFSGFKKAKQIKISITDGFKYNYVVTYCFNSSGGSGSLYTKLHRYLRKRSNIYV